ncbi:MAG: 16S rRNA (adenine(1518)-N(6)/adenine(1519)-N(6))-dimethyltransferase RsmA [bacterium]|nr:16S rRNA (adenine(1518)-N(6)/adenine(1519)-N(6))-dimethyltransferase RsmA [bacterium]
MDLTNPSYLRKLLRARKLQPNKVLGQHFLVSKEILRRIIEAADLKKTDTVLEAGPGLGALTQVLAQHVGRVIAVEKDRALIPILQELFADHKNVEIVQGDILKFDLVARSLRGMEYKIVADIPYYLTSRFLRIFLETPHQPASLTILVQKEVAQRIAARPPHATLLSNAVQYYAEPKIISMVSKSAFFPQPKVDSAILKLAVSRVYDEKADKAFFALLKNAFSAPRKQLFHTLSRCYFQESREKYKSTLLHFRPASPKLQPASQQGGRGEASAENTGPNALYKNSDVGTWLAKTGIKATQRPGEIALEKWLELLSVMGAEAVS